MARTISSSCRRPLTGIGLVVLLVLTGCRAAASPRPRSSADIDFRDDELARLTEAQRALDDDPERTLALCSADARLAPLGLLGQEREALAIIALARLRRTDDARARANVFFLTWPDAVATAAVRAAAYGGR